MNTPTPPPAQPLVADVPGCAPQQAPQDRVMLEAIVPANSWAAAMKLVSPQAGLAKG